jgi:hypothetical protein
MRKMMYLDSLSLSSNGISITPFVFVMKLRFRTGRSHLIQLLHVFVLLGVSYPVPNPTLAFAKSFPFSPIDGRFAIRAFH